MKGHRQEVSVESNWLTDMAEQDRQFVKGIYLEEGVWWTEITDEEKVEWEEAHKPEPEVPEAEVVE